MSLSHLKGMIYSDSTLYLEEVINPDTLEFIKHEVLQDTNWTVNTPIVTDKGAASGLQNVNHLYADNVPFNGHLMDQIMPILSVLKAAHIVRVKFNYTYPQHKRTEGWHYDVDDSVYYPGMKIAVINFTTCNASTKLEDGIEIPSVKNTGLIFDANRKHAGCSFDDVDYRLTLNVVYFPELSLEEKEKTM